jgi:hypothetical protein
MAPGPNLAMGIAAEDLPEGQMVAGACAGKPVVFAEMEEIAAFAGEDVPTNGIYKSIAALYHSLAEDHAGPKRDVAALDAFLRPDPPI